MAEDRLFINITPKRFNKSPAVLFEDITGINISVNINLYYIIWILISIVAAFSTSGAGLILTAIFIFCGIQRKIIISKRNGVRVVMYTGTKSVAEEFKNDMKKVARIR